MCSSRRCSFLCTTEDGTSCERNTQTTVPATWGSINTFDILVFFFYRAKLAIYDSRCYVTAVWFKPQIQMADASPSWSPPRSCDRFVSCSTIVYGCGANDRWWEVMAGTVISEIVFDIDGGTPFKIAWLYNDSDPLEEVVTEVLSVVRQNTGVASQDQFQILTTNGAVITLQRCIKNVLQGNASAVSTVKEGQLLLQLQVLGKVASKGRATAAAPAGEGPSCAGSCSTQPTSPTVKCCCRMYNVQRLVCMMRCRCQQGQEQRQESSPEGQQQEHSSSTDRAANEKPAAQHSILHVADAHRDYSGGISYMIHLSSWHVSRCTPAAARLQQHTHQLAEQ